MPVPSARRAGPSQRGLDWLNFFVADVQTGFGPFIAVTLAAHGWTDTGIGAALSLGTVAAMASQLPAGWLVDVMPSRRLAAALGILALGVGALAIGLRPTTVPVMAAEILHGFASGMIVPAIAAISLGLVGPGAAGERLGRNARWSSIGNGLAAAAMGACGTYLSTAAVFLLAAALCVPALLALSALAPPGRAASDRPPSDCSPSDRGPTGARPTMLPRRLFRDRGLLTFAACAALFQLANAAMLPLIAAISAKRDGAAASAIIAACILVPQLVVAAFSPWVGRAAERRGRRPLLLLGVAALPLRALLLATLPPAGLLIPLQVLDGIGAATFGVLVPLIAADIAGGTGRFSLCMGAIGLAVGIGASASTMLAGWAADRWGEAPAFLALAAAGAAAFLLVRLAMPETRIPAGTRPIAGG